MSAKEEITQRQKINVQHLISLNLASIVNFAKGTPCTRKQSKWFVSDIQRSAGQ
jgi:hypothetical protein